MNWSRVVIRANWVSLEGEPNQYSTKLFPPWAMIHCILTLPNLILTLARPSMTLVNPLQVCTINLAKALEDIAFRTKVLDLKPYWAMNLLTS